MSSSAREALSVQRLSAQALLSFAILSLLSSILIVWLYVGRNIIRRLMRLNDDMLAISSGSHHTPIDISGSDEITEMGRVVEIFRKNTLERDELLEEKEHAAERLEQQIKERTRELAQSVEELRALGEVSQAVNSTIDLETVLSTIVMKATQLSGTDAGAIYVLDDEQLGIPAARHLRDGRQDSRRNQGPSYPHRRDSDGRAAEKRMPIQIQTFRKTRNRSWMSSFVRDSEPC